MELLSQSQDIQNSTIPFTACVLRARTLGPADSAFFDFPGERPSDDGWGHGRMFCAPYIHGWFNTPLEQTPKPLPIGCKANPFIVG